MNFEDERLQRKNEIDHSENLKNPFIGYSEATTTKVGTINKRDNDALMMSVTCKKLFNSYCVSAPVEGW